MRPSTCNYRASRASGATPWRACSILHIRRGDLVRQPLADLREAQYRANGKDCYLFNLDDAIVIDATMCGNWARFTVSGAAKGFGGGGGDHG